MKENSKVDLNVNEKVLSTKDTKSRKYNKKLHKN